MGRHDGEPSALAAFGLATSRFVASGRQHLAAGDQTSSVKGNLAGIVAMVVGTAFFVVGDASMKLMAAKMPTGETIFIRGIIATALVWAIVVWSGALVDIRRFAGRALALRTVGDVGGAVCFQSGLARLPFADVGALLQINPLIVTAGAALFLGEKVGWRRWAATAIGLAGALLIIKPGSSTFQWASLLLVGSTLFTSMRDLSTRRLPPGMPAILIAALSITAITISSLGFLPFEQWRAPSVADIGFLAIPAVCSLIGQFCVVLSIRAGDISAVVPFRYAAILWSLVASLLIWQELPDVQTFVGIGIIVSAGLYTFHRERMLGARTAGQPA